MTDRYRVLMTRPKAIPPGSNPDWGGEIETVEIARLPRREIAHLIGSLRYQGCHVDSGSFTFEAIHDSPALCREGLDGCYELAAPDGECHECRQWRLYEHDYDQALGVA